MTTEANLQQGWIDTRMRVLEAIDAELAREEDGGKQSRVILELAEAYAWLTRPDQGHGSPPASA